MACHVLLLINKETFSEFLTVTFKKDWELTDSKQCNDAFCLIYTFSVVAMDLPDSPWPRSFTLVTMSNFKTQKVDLNKLNDLKSCPVDKTSALGLVNTTWLSICQYHFTAHTLCRLSLCVISKLQCAILNHLLHAIIYLIQSISFFAVYIHCKTIQSIFSRVHLLTLTF